MSNQESLEEFVKNSPTLQELFDIGEVKHIPWTWSFIWNYQKKKIDELERLKRVRNTQVVASIGEVEELKKQIKDYEEALEYLLDANMVVDEATVPSAGINSAPEQVVFNWSCSYLRIKKAREVLDKWGEG